MLQLKNITGLGRRPIAVESDAAPAPTALGDSNIVRQDGREYRLFFLCGHPKSGTNWIGALLNLHPQINCRGEFRFEALRNAYDTMERHWWHVAHDEPVRSAAERCFRESVCRIMAAAASGKPGAMWIGDRTPRVLRPLISGAPHIYSLRDPRDVLVSWAHQEIREAGFFFSAEPHRTNLRHLHEEFTNDPQYFNRHPERLLENEAWVRALSRRYFRHVSMDLENLRKIESGELDAPVHIVRYESLHADLDRERSTLYRFLGLKPSEAEAPSRGTRTLPGFERVDPTSFFRKGAAGDWKNHFASDARRWFKEETGELLIELGYESDTNW